eukprot:CAMPEP_0183358124 /NCGR_PEP_ID=MMETSP0164_2-20130417/48285_1 /TAXON_ID=221442 /ORGANISM="Coccolithus pelagicus ssp braarudi, Strain PLY182g" /LENGTH=50 /DNA_ID=CAMNT_0025531943 /DNA_START=83 /DNA_END=232 /DNA_ORIENTATION=-
MRAGSAHPALGSRVCVFADLECASVASEQAFWHARQTGPQVAEVKQPHLW